MHKCQITEQMQQRILITGAAGFLGSHLCDFFIMKDFHVIGLDNFITGKKDNIEHLFQNEKFEFFLHDVSKYVHVPGSLDYILHFASPASPVDYLSMPIQTLKVSSLGTHNLLGLAKEKKARILIASSSEIYGDPMVNPQNESYWGHVNPVGPRGVYDEGKRFQEALTMAYHNTHGIETRIARIFNTFGPRMRKNDGRAIPAFFDQAINFRDITIFGDGNQTRSFCYVDDLVEGIFKLLMSEYHLPVNLGNPEEITINSLASEILKIADNNISKIVYSGLPQDDPHVRCPDISLAKKILDWQPLINRIQGLEKTYEYYLSQNAKLTFH